MPVYSIQYHLLEVNPNVRVLEISFRYCSAFVIVHNFEDLYSCILDWLNERPAAKPSRSLLAGTTAVGGQDFWNAARSDVTLDSRLDRSDW